MTYGHGRGGALAAAAALTLLAGSAAGGDGLADAKPLIGSVVTITLTTGEVLKGVLAGESTEAVALEHARFGMLTLPRAEVAGLASAEAAATGAGASTGGGVVVASAGASGETAPAPAPAEQPADPAPEEPTSFFDGWTGSFELGLAGSSGNTERFGFRTALGFERLTSTMESRWNTNYKYATEEGDTSENRFFSEFRNDWLFKDSPWRFYALGSAEYDEFQDWDWRFSVFAGFGYEFIDNDRTFLLGRVGAGGSYELGGQDERFRPELNLGLDFSHKITDRQTITANVDFYPSLDPWGDYRVVAKAAYEILVDPESNLTLKLGVEDRYDSNPGSGNKRNDIDYFALMVWKF